MKKKIIWVISFIFFICALFLTNKYLNNKTIEEININQNKEEIEESNENFNIAHDESVVKDNIVQVTSDNFDDIVLNTKKMVLVDFYADWCPPCKMLSPVIEEVANENNDENLVFVRINIDDESEIANKYGIQSIPTLILVQDGKEIKRSIGYINKENVLEFINN